MRMPGSSCSRLRICSEAEGSPCTAPVTLSKPGAGQPPGVSAQVSAQPVSFAQVAARVAVLYDGLVASIPTKVKCSSLGTCGSAPSLGSLVSSTGGFLQKSPSSLSLTRPAVAQGALVPNRPVPGHTQQQQPQQEKQQEKEEEEDEVDGSGGGKGSRGKGLSRTMRRARQKQEGRSAGFGSHDRVLALGALALLQNLVFLAERCKRTQILPHHQQQQQQMCASVVSGSLQQGDVRAACVPGSLLATPALSQFYKVLHELGRGHLGLVRLCRCRATDRLFACKTVPKASITKLRQVEEVTAEVLALAELQLSGGGLTRGANSGPFLVRLHEVFDDAEAIHLVLDYCEVGDLLTHVLACGRLPEAQCAAMLLQLLTALADVHRAGLVHRDIKPENILLTRGGSGRRSGLCRSVTLRMGHRECQSDRDLQFRLADLGSCARVSPGEALFGFAGSPKYMAPEIVEGRPYGQEVDVWSLGVVLYACLAGRQPFVGETLEDVFGAVCSSSPDFSSSPWCILSDEARGLVSAMLCKEPSKRITISGILHHPWMLRHAVHSPATRHAMLSPSPLSIAIQG